MNYSDVSEGYIKGGLVDGLYYKTDVLVDRINDRAYSRNFPDSPLQPYFTPRATPTRYSHFPITNLRTEPSVPLIPYPEYSVEYNFNPGNAPRGPGNGFFSNVDRESVLRNQFFALDKNSDKGVYVPESKSDLYNDAVPHTSEVVQQPFPLLFNSNTEQIETRGFTGGAQIGENAFNNSTRTQLRQNVRAMT
jgi:hypothetical protein